MKAYCLVRILSAAVMPVLVGLVVPIGEAKSDIFVYKDSQGILHFTNAPTHPGYQRMVRESDIGSRPSSRSGGLYGDVIRAASERYGVDNRLVRAVIKVESDFQSRARSPKGAQGLMQLMPETARLHNVADAFDPNENIEGGVRHLRLLLDRYGGDLELSLAAYNAGIKAVEKYKGIPPFAETREYIQRVLDHFRRYRASDPTAGGQQARR